MSSIICYKELHVAMKNLLIPENDVFIHYAFGKMIISIINLSGR
jgi:hypothetical protein